MRKEIHLGIVDVVLTDEDIMFVDDGEIYYLSDETGWWDGDTIYIWQPGLLKRQKLGIGVHEFVERLLTKIGVPDNISHRVANYLEYVFSLGKADLYWR